MATNEQLADEIISRLNKLIATPETRCDIALLLTRNVPASTATTKHPTLQCSGMHLTVLGFLNGIVGVDTQGRGLIAKILNSKDELIGFTRTPKSE